MDHSGPHARGLMPDIARASPTDVLRWQANASAAPSWIDRNRVLAEWIRAGSSVLDVGAGSMNLRGFLPPDCRYVPVDVVLADASTRFADFNAFLTPAVDEPFDHVVCSGLLEYVVDPDFALRTLAGWGRRVILSYALAAAAPDLDARRRAGWVNHLSADALDKLIGASGLTILARRTWQSQHLFLLEPRPATMAATSDGRWPVSLFRADRTNVGDWHSAPARYFPAFAGPEVDIFNISSATRIDTGVLIGGGGLFHPMFNVRFDEIRFSPRHPVVGWGVGENMRIDTAGGWVDEGPVVTPEWANRCDLLGVRDFGASARWAPCASCLHPSLDVSRTPVHEVVVFEHKRIPIDAGGLPLRSNDGDDLDAVLDFLGSGHVVVTNSYHGAYWATLLGRAVVALPFSSKFWGLRHRPILCRPNEWRRALAFARPYPMALRDCRQATLAFARDAQAAFEQDPTSASRVRRRSSPRTSRSSVGAPGSIWTDDAQAAAGLATLRLGAVQQRIAAQWLADRGPVYYLEDAARLPPRGSQWRSVVVAPGVVPPASLRRNLAASGQVVIAGAEDRRLDRFKEALRDHAHVGCEGPRGLSLWRGGMSVPRRPPSKMDLPCVVSYYTANTPYEDEARDLVASCQAAGVSSDVRPAPARGTWEANCAYKATFIRDIWRERRQPILWVDADARVRRPPDLLRGATADFAIHKVRGWQFASGTLFFNATGLAGVLLETWERLCRRHPHVFDQVLLDAAWEEVASQHPLETLWLPPAYTSIFDHAEALADPDPPVVMHFQASRRLKLAVSPLATPRPAPEVPAAWRQARRASRAWVDATGAPRTAATVSDPDFVRLPGAPAKIPAAFRRYDARIVRWLSARQGAFGRVAIFGASWFGARLAARLRRAGCEPVAFLDNADRARGTSVMGIPVLAPTPEVLDRLDAVVVASIEHSRAIDEQLRTDTTGGGRFIVVAAHRLPKSI